MKSRNVRTPIGRLVLACLLLVVFTGTSLAAGLLTPADDSLPELEIKDHQVKVVIEDGYAITTVEQVFHNPHPNDLEAVYSFPVPEKGAVSEFTMWIDSTAVHGEVLEKAKARKVYDEQKAAGNDAGLTEKDSYKTFDISVSPVRAGQDTRIRFSYMQPAKVDSGMGRYLYPLEEGGVDEAKLAFWTANEKVMGTFSFDLEIRSAYPVDGVRLPNHPNAVISRQGDVYRVHISTVSRATPTEGDQPGAPIVVDQGGSVSGGQVAPVYSLDTDIVVYYRHADNLPGSVDLVTYKPEPDKRGTFMLTLTPGMDLQPITEGRDWVFVLDISGSMQGKYQTLADGVGKALQKLAKNERFRIILFNTSAKELTQGYTQASAVNVQQYIERVRRIVPGKGTNVYDGLQMGLERLDSDRTSTIILVTDGVANVGVTEQKKFVELVRTKDVRLFTFIMGNSANLPMLHAVTKASGGFSMGISNSDDIVGTILLAQSKVTHEALHGAALKIKGIRTFDLTPDRIGSLYRGQQLVVLGHYTGGGQAEVSLNGKISGHKKMYSSSFDFPRQSGLHPELERLWAYATIEQLSAEMEDFGEEADMKEAVTDLGVEYGLVTDYTSMVVVRDEVFQQLGMERRNRDRLQTEYAAREQRSKQGVTNRRVDAAKPMFTAKRPTTRSSGGGSGAFDGWALVLIAPLVFFGFRKKADMRR